MSTGGEQQWDLSGRLAERYREEQPRRILALDGGGIRGCDHAARAAATRRTSLLRRSTPDRNFRLCDFFDLIGGTSTGAIIATALARRMSVAEVAAFYATSATRSSSNGSSWSGGVALRRRELAQKLRRTFGAGTDLAPSQPRLSSRRRHAERDNRLGMADQQQPVCQVQRSRDAPTATCASRSGRLVRASTAAPVFFPPEIIRWDPNDDEKAFVFVDGGTTPYNNPAFLLFRMATEPAYQLGWPTGERNLLLISVGTGSSPVIGAPADDPDTNVLSSALTTLSGPDVSSVGGPGRELPRDRTVHVRRHHRPRAPRPSSRSPLDPRVEDPPRDRPRQGVHLHPDTTRSSRGTGWRSSALRRSTPKESRRWIPSTT